MISQPKKHFLSQFLRCKGKGRQMLLGLQLRELPEWATSYICFFTPCENKKYRNPVLLPLALYSSRKTTDELDWDLGVSMFQGSSSHATLGAAVQIPKASLMITEEYFSLGNVEKAALISLFPDLSCCIYTSIVWKMQLGTCLQIILSSWWFGLVYFYFFPIRII